MIKRFRDSYFFLSNFYPVNIRFDGIEYSSVEAAFQASKSTSYSIRKKFAKVDGAQAKSMGRRVALRPDWEKVKLGIMYELCYTKFTENESLKSRLIATGTQEIIEGNFHGDTYWGMVDGKGLNMLGKILMRIREEIK